MKRSIFLIFLCIVSTFSLAYAQQGTKLTKDARMGSRGQEVLLIQRALQAKGFLSQEPTGSYLMLTRAAVIKYQRDQKLPVTGVIDAKTRVKIAPLIKEAADQMAKEKLAADIKEKANATTTKTITNNVPTASASTTTKSVPKKSPVAKPVSGVASATKEVVAAPPVPTTNAIVTPVIVEVAPKTNTTDAFYDIPEFDQSLEDQS